MSLSLLLLVLLLGLATFLSGSETALTALNRYRLLRQVKAGHPGALRAQALLRHPEQLRGFMRVARYSTALLAATLTTWVSLRLEDSLTFASLTGLLTLALLICAETIPKTLAVHAPDRLAYGAAWVLLPMVRAIQPLLWIIDRLADLLLFTLGLPAELPAPTPDELRHVLASGDNPDRYRNMLLSVLELESASVEDIMVPRHDIAGLDFDLPLDTLITHIRDSRHTRLPVYRKSLDKVIGMLHLRKALIRMSHGDFSKEALNKCLDKMYFVPSHMPLDRLLTTFRREHLRMGLVVDEYGDVLGLVTLEDLLREIVGEFAAEPHHDLIKAKDGSYLVDAGLSLRELNRVTGWNLPTEGPKTLNGLIIEYLETIPAAGTRLELGHLDMEITKMENNVIKQVRIYP